MPWSFCLKTPNGFEHSQGESKRILVNKFSMKFFINTQKFCHIWRLSAGHGQSFRSLLGYSGEGSRTPVASGRDAAARIVRARSRNASNMASFSATGRCASARRQVRLLSMICCRSKVMIHLAGAKPLGVSPVELLQAADCLDRRGMAICLHPAESISRLGDSATRVSGLLSYSFIDDEITFANHQ